ncbi:MAG: hypothetical protein Q8861_09255 [Bacteroidota bacterium]|nr:hypothetical protein [Bacteroidota bacterium]
MEQKSKKSIHFYMRGLHRDVGFLILGMVLIYCVSGVTMILRDKGFLQQEKQIEKTIAPGLEASALGEILHIKGLKVLKTQNDTVYFKEGTYNKATGTVNYSETNYPTFLKKITDLHKAPSKKITSIFSIIFGILLAFMAVSAFWMFKPGTRLFRRGILFVGIGIVVVIVLLLL